MKLQLSEIMEATVSELEDIDMTLAFEIEAIERQLSGNHDAGRVWKEKAIKARDHMQRTRNLVKQRLDKLYYGEERLLHGVILRMIRRDMSINRFMEYVNRAKIESGLRGGK